MAKIVIIDDEAAVLKMMSQLCERLGHETYAFQTGTEGMSFIRRNTPEILIVDLKIGDMDGLDIIQQCHIQYPNMAIIMVTGYGSVKIAVDAMKYGAFDYLSKPFELDDLQRIISRAVTKGSAEESQKEDPFTRSTVAPLGERSRVVGSSTPIKEIMAVVKKVADNDSPVLLDGEFGSGKQMVARALHNQSRRNSAPFKVLHCSALPEELLEMELFGGAAHAGETIFMRAQGGTVVLEEVNVLPKRLQSQLDAFLEDVNNRRVQGSLPANLDFRFVATTTKPLEKEVAEGKFREDLFYRISIIPLMMPPLRSRKEDIDALADHFLKNYAKISQTKVKSVDKYALQLLTNYAWPGNVGELQNAIERACTFAEDDRIRPVDLPPKITQKIEITDEENQKLKHQLPIGGKLSDYIKKQEKIFIQETLKYNEGSREKTASMLGVSIATLYRKMGLKLERDKMLTS
ncbi:MAG: response regulator [Verrucomicrobiaceae bacterium]|jgi:DNA-binding NtrC family response regulator|nr:sigma-54 dependent transcriptional regulator [Verrucomicrobiales bacterium]NCF84105.1 response regulator [Verrucomicrobiaceae bacterium]NCF89366.1 response regulator [Verrucomicrobiaceae bacterium]